MSKLERPVAFGSAGSCYMAFSSVGSTSVWFSLAVLTLIQFISVWFFCFASVLLYYMSAIQAMVQGVNTMYIMRHEGNFCYITFELT